MFSGYVVVAVLAAALNGWAATADLTGARMARDNAARVGVPSTWLLPLGGLKAAGALGLLVGIAVPAVGLAAAIGLILLFVCAVVAHLRVRWYATLAFPGTFLLLAVGALVLRLASMGGVHTLVAGRPPHRKCQWWLLDSPTWKVEHAFVHAGRRCLAKRPRCSTNQTYVLSNSSSTLPEERR
ncbi:MAG TPA: DoxX family protein [Propionibacteriaceae bacterium]|jgi:hypothetical protein|nr:DoxX family protein [Propionibacteriaceae bacterium]